MFFHTHTHSEYSVLDGMSRVKQLVNKAKSDSQKAIALTEHGKMASVPELLLECKANDIKPIVGQEFYITQTNKERDRQNTHHITLLGLNDSGYKILCELSSIASEKDNFYYNPRIDHEILRGYSQKDLKNIVAYTACMNGEIPQAILKNKSKQAIEILKIYRNIFPNLFLEFMSHAIQETDDEEEILFRKSERKINKALWEIHNKYDIPIVITNDSHYTNRKQAKAHNVLLAIQSGSTIDNPSRFKFTGEGYWFKTENEMKKVFPQEIWKESSKSLSWIYENSNIKLKEFTDNKFYIPNTGEKNPLKKVASICLTNLKQRIKKEDWPKYKKQLAYELNVVDKAKFTNEFLVVYDYVNWARNNGISVSEGRGSMVGVLISYLMRITNVDPLRFNLSFENALNPARPSLPDFDIDFDNKEAVIDYVKNKYGEDNVMKIGTFNRMNPRSLLGSILRAKGYNNSDIIQYTKELPDTFDIVGAKASGDLKVILSDLSSNLEDLMSNDKEIAKLMFEFDGLIKSMGSHAGGIIIADGTQSLRKMIPGVRIRDDTELVSQFDKKDVEKIGFIKFDILSITTLKLMKETISLIGSNVFENFPDNSELDDEKVFDLINNDLLTFVFQLDGIANRSVIKKIDGIHNFEDIVSVTSLSRPGSAKFIPEFAKNKKKKKIKYLVKELAPILDRSNGVILYIEQVMKMVQEISGFDFAQIDNVRKMIKGKDRALFAEIRPSFIEGCIENGYSKQKAELLWQMIESVSGYLFNRAHAVAYSLIAYMTAYLKAYYPLEFFYSRNEYS